MFTVKPRVSLVQSMRCYQSILTKGKSDLVTTKFLGTVSLHYRCSLAVQHDLFI